MPMVMFVIMPVIMDMTVIMDMSVLLFGAQFANLVPDSSENGSPDDY